jgi:spermidine/putrescine transport system ATP-binding protein
MTSPLVEIRNISHRYGGVPVLDDISLDIARGSYTVLLGPSGSGKTTLLSILGGFVEPTSGQVLIGGEDYTHVPPAKRPTTTVFQDYALFPHMTIGGNVGFGLMMRGVAAHERRRQASEALRLVGLEGAFGRRPHELSGGQRQRAALARALVVKPAVLLLDEPLGALDLKLRRQMQDELKAIQKRVGTAFVHVTHDQEEAMALADLLVVLNRGRIEDSGPPERVYARPRTRFSAGFMGESTLLDGRAEGQAGTRLVVETPLGRLEAGGEAPVGAPVSLAVRPENLALRPGEGRSVELGAARVQDIVFQGSFKRILATSDRVAQLRIVVKLPIGEQLAPGDRIELFCRPSDLILLTD